MKGERRRCEGLGGVMAEITNSDKFVTQPKKKRSILNRDFEMVIILTYCQIT